MRGSPAKRVVQPCRQQQEPPKRLILARCRGERRRNLRPFRASGGESQARWDVNGLVTLDDVLEIVAQEFDLLVSAIGSGSWLERKRRG
ncbi:MAG: hypothetical protein HIU89_00880 [Proteobacteria bacterium]|nr:hypothetical protein [Pseudomonadota bacterium]